MNKTMKKTALTVAALALCCALFLTGCGTVSAAAPAAETPDTVTVSASSSVQLAPDKASVTFGVNTQKSTAAQAQESNAEAVQSVIAVLTERGIEEKSIRTGNYSMYPRYDYSSSGGSRIVGYTVCTTLTIQDQDIDSVGKLLSDCVAAGINSVDSVTFLCSTYDDAYNDALAQAVQAAREKAEALAAAAGKTVGEAVTVTEGWQDTSARYTRQASNVAYDEAMEAAGKLAFMPGESEITASVTVVYRMQ